jgi:hypothetical protein
MAMPHRYGITRHSQFNDDKNVSSIIQYDKNDPLRLEYVILAYHVKEKFFLLYSLFLQQRIASGG